MDNEQSRVDSQDALAVLADQFQDKRYRDGYVASHTRSVLARQMRNFRGEQSQGDFGAEIGKRQTIISRLENPAYAGWSLRTMLEVARKLNVAVFARFVDFPTFLKYTGDLSSSALCPSSFNNEAIAQITGNFSAPSSRADMKEISGKFKLNWRIISFRGNGGTIEINTRYEPGLKMSMITANDDSRIEQILMEHTNVG